MKTKLACVLGLAAFVMSLTCGASLVHADALEAASSGLLTLAPEADANGAGSLDQLHCVLYSDGADNCIVNAQPAAADSASFAVDAIEPSVIASAPAVQFVDAIAVAVVQTVTIAAPGLDARDNEEPAYTGSIPAPSATEPVLNPDAEITTGAFQAPAGQSADAIVVAVVQTVTIEVPGQIPDGVDAALTESIAEPAAPILFFEAKTTALDHVE